MGKRRVHTFAVITALVVAACQAANPIPSSPTAPSAPASGVPSGQPSAPPASGSPVASLPPAPPTSQQLIRADLDAGTIDFATSLQLRAWALFGDARLPERYDGSGSTGEDAAVLDEIAESLDTLPVEKRAELARYLLRPSQAESPFSATTAQALAMTGPFIAQETQQNGPCRDGFWFFRDWTPAGGSASDGFRVWACSQRPNQTNADFDKVVAIATQLWPKMTAPSPQGMGRPVPDDYTAGDQTPRGDGNGKVDVYLVDALVPCRQRGENCATLEGDAAGIAPKDYPRHCDVSGFPEAGCSAYMVLPRGLTDNVLFPGLFAHEFFHVLQHAHNGKIKLTWYHEASATWAGWYYERESYKAKAYKRFEAYQAAQESLLRYDYDQEFQYQAWGWPLFQYVEGGDSNVFQAWAEIENAVTPAQVDHAIDLQLPFEDGFREFAVANAQPTLYTFEGGTGLDDIRWQTHPELTDFPENDHFVDGDVRTINLGRQTVPVDVAPLTAKYHLFQVLDDNIEEIHIDLLGVAGADFLDLDAVGQLGDSSTWKRFRGVDGRLVFCRDKADQNVKGALEVVVSNHLAARDLTYDGFPDRNLHAKGDYLIQATDEQTDDCNPTFVILHAVLTGDRVETLQTTHASFDVYIKWHQPNDARDPLNMTFMSGSFSFQSTVNGVCGGSRSGGGNFQAADDFTQNFYENDDIHSVGAGLSDQRETYGRIMITFSADYEMPNDDPLCQPPDHGGISTCPLIWTPTPNWDSDTLPVAANCTDTLNTTTWTATLVPEQ